MRHTLTYEQFVMYTEIETQRQTSEIVTEATGTAFAIAQCFGEKKALRTFRRRLEGSQRGVGAASPAAGDSEEMAEIRRRMRAMGVTEKRK